MSVLGDFIKFSFGFIFFLIPIPRGGCSPACRANCPKLSSFSGIDRAAFGSLAWKLYAFFFSFFLNNPLPFFQLKWRSLHRYLLPIKWILHYQPHSRICFTLPSLALFLWGCLAVCQGLMARIQNLAHFIPSKSFLNISSLLLRPSMRNPRTCSKRIGGGEGEKRKMI